LNLLLLNNHDSSYLGEAERKEKVKETATINNVDWQKSIWKKA
jgi:hypothetical protein